MRSRARTRSRRASKRRCRREWTRSRSRSPAAGVDALFVIAKVNDLTVEPEGEDIEVKVRVTLLLVDQPSNAVRGSLSASAGATLSARASREAQQETKAEAAEMLADALYLDLKKALAE